MILEACRPWAWRAYLWMGILGFLLGKLKGAPLFLVSMVVFLATAFAVNNYFDVENDKNRPDKKNPFVKENGRKALFPILAAQIFCLLLNNPFSWPGFIYWAMVLLAVMYSAPPFRLKGRPLLDVASHALFFGAFPFLYGLLLAGGSVNDKVLGFVSTISLYSAFLQLRNLRDDRKEDAAAGDRTTFVVFPKAGEVLLWSAGFSSLILSTLILGKSAWLTSLLLIIGFVVSGRIERAIDLAVVAGLTLEVIF